MTTDVTVPRSLIEPSEWRDFYAWAKDGGYDESYFNRYDSKSLALQESYLREREQSDAS